MSVSAGAGQIPAIPHPIPNMTAPTISFLSIPFFSGKSIGSLKMVLGCGFLTGFVLE